VFGGSKTPFNRLPALLICTLIIANIVLRGVFWQMSGETKPAEGVISKIARLRGGRLWLAGGQRPHLIPIGLYLSMPLGNLRVPLAPSDHPWGEAATDWLAPCNDMFN